MKNRTNEERESVLSWSFGTLFFGGGSGPPFVFGGGAFNKVFSCFWITTKKYTKKREKNFGVVFFISLKNTSVYLCIARLCAPRRKTTTTRRRRRRRRKRDGKRRGEDDGREQRRFGAESRGRDQRQSRSNGRKSFRENFRTGVEERRDERERDERDVREASRETELEEEKFDVLGLGELDRGARATADSNLRQREQETKRVRKESPRDL